MCAAGSGKAPSSLLGNGFWGEPGFDGGIAADFLDSWSTPAGLCLGGVDERIGRGLCAGFGAGFRGPCRSSYLVRAGPW